MPLGPMGCFSIASGPSPRGGLLFQWGFIVLGLGLVRSKKSQIVPWWLPGFAETLLHNPEGAPGLQSWNRGKQWLKFKTSRQLSTSSKGNRSICERISANLARIDFDHRRPVQTCAAERHSLHQCPRRHQRRRPQRPSRRVAGNAQAKHFQMHAADLPLAPSSIVSRNLPQRAQICLQLATASAHKSICKGFLIAVMHCKLWIQCSNILIQRMQMQAHPTSTQTKELVPCLAGS